MSTEKYKNMMTKVYLDCLFGNYEGLNLELVTVNGDTNKGGEVVVTKITRTGELSCTSIIIERLPFTEDNYYGSHKKYATDGRNTCMGTLTLCDSMKRLRGLYKGSSLLDSLSSFPITVESYQYHIEDY